MSQDGEKKATLCAVGNWLWGLIEGQFNEQQSISQIIVDALIGMVPVAGDVTAIRDLIAVIIRLIEHPEKRKEVLEWVMLVLLLFALIPLAGGAIKGIGKLLIKGAEGAGKHAALLRDIVLFLNRIGEGNAVKFIKELSFEKYAPEVLAKWKELARRLDLTCGKILVKMGDVIPAAMKARIQQIQKGLKELSALAESMIPEAIKDLEKRLKAIQHCLHEGEWEKIGNAITGKGKQAYAAITREAEARLVDEMDSVTGEVTPKWVGKDLRFPANAKRDFQKVNGWPDLESSKFQSGKEGAWAIKAFSGPMEAITVPPGTKIYRIVTIDSNTAGLWWAYKVADSGPAWRKEFAVLDRFSADGYYVEMRVGPQGLRAWRGKVAGQLDSMRGSECFGQYFEGGATQLLVDFDLPANAYQAAEAKALGSKRISTGWDENTMANMNVPAKGTTLQRLGTWEIEPKAGEKSALRAQLGAKSARAISTPSSDNDASQTSSNRGEVSAQ